MLAKDGSNKKYSPQEEERVLISYRRIEEFPKMIVPKPTIKNVHASIHLHLHFTSQTTMKKHLHIL